MPVVPAIRAAEAGELLEPGRWRLQRAEIAPLHSSLAPGNGMRLCLKIIIIITNNNNNNTYPIGLGLNVVKYTEHFVQYLAHESQHMIVT